MTTKKVEMVKLKSNKKRFMVIPLMLTFSPLIATYSFMREVLEEGSTVRGWASSTLKDMLMLIQGLFLGKYSAKLEQGRSSNDRYYRLLSSKASKRVVKAFMNSNLSHFKMYANKFDKLKGRGSIYYYSNDTNHFVAVRCYGKDKYSFEYQKPYYIDNMKNVKCEYLMTEEQILTVIESYTK